MLMAPLALRDLWRERVFFLCNLVVMVGVLVRLLVLIGVKNGVYQALVGQFPANPATLQIDTRGNAALTEADIAPLRAWPEVAFVVPRTRSQFDDVTLQAQPGGPILRAALLLPTGAGDPNLPPGLVLQEDDIALSDLVARQVQVQPGDRVTLVTLAQGRPHQLILSRQVRLILPAATIAGRSLLAPYSVLDLVEAFYDAYALPDHGVPEGRDQALRVPRYEGLRLYARHLSPLGALQARVGQALGLATSARTREVEAVRGLGRNLDIAMAPTAALAALGLAAALIFAFWSDVTRKRHSLAVLAILGLGSRRQALLPPLQAALTAGAGPVLRDLCPGRPGRGPAVRGGAAAGDFHRGHRTGRGSGDCGWGSGDGSGLGAAQRSGIAPAGGALMAMRRRWFLLLILRSGLAGGPPALAQGGQSAWPVDLYDPGAKAHGPADLILPLPCGGAMAFQQVDLPMAAGDPLADLRLRLGQSAEAMGFAIDDLSFAPASQPDPGPAARARGSTTPVDAPFGPAARDAFPPALRAGGAGRSLGQDQLALSGDAQGIDLPVEMDARDAAALGQGAGLVQGGIVDLMQIRRRDLGRADILKGRRGREGRGWGQWHCLSPVRCKIVRLTQGQ